MATKEMRSTLRYLDAFNWVRRGARHHPSVQFTASIGDLWLSCWLDNGRQKIQTHYYPMSTLGE